MWLGPGGGDPGFEASGEVQEWSVRRFWLRLIWAPIFAQALSLFGQAGSVTLPVQTTSAQNIIQQTKREVVVGAAANFSEAFRAMGPKFEAATGIHAIFSFGSTAQLAQQVEQGAPFDVFAAADAEHPQKLEREGWLQSRAVFARGVLALWLPSGEGNLGSLGEGRFRVIAMAKPELAPYGAAAVEALKRAGVWEQVKAKVVYAENVGMARQYGESGNADAVLTAYSLVIHARGKILRIDPRLHRPLDHEVGVISGGKHLVEARAFVEFLLHGGGQGVLQEFGYQAVTTKAPAVLKLPVGR